MRLPIDLLFEDSRPTASLNATLTVFPGNERSEAPRIRVNISLQFHFNELYNLFISVYQLPKPPCRIVNLVGCCEVFGKCFVI